MGNRHWPEDAIAKLAELNRELASVRIDRETLQDAMQTMRDYPDGGTPSLHAVQRIASEALDKINSDSE